MSRVEEKLEHFASDVMSDVGEERRAMIDELDQELLADYDQKENAYLEKAYDIIQNALVEIEQKKKENMSQILMRNRSRLFEKRREVIARVYKRATEELLAFKKTDAYKDHLVKLIEGAREVLSDGDLLVRLDYSDKVLKPYIEEKTGLQVVLESKKVNMIGGCILQNTSNNTIVDRAFSRKLENAREGLVEICHLEID